MKKAFYLLVLFTLLITACGGGSAPAAEQPASKVTATEAPATTGNYPVEVRWFIGLGTGTSPEQVAVENQVVERFNSANPEIKLSMETVAFEASRDTLSTELAAGNPPGVVGPVGILGSEAFRGKWLNLASLIQESGYDLKQFDPASLKLFEVGGGEQIGIPIALYPSIVYYNRDLFDEAGLNYPPKKYGDPYVWPDGTEAEWNFDTYREVAMKLTVDNNGHDATQPEFDPENIVQYGFDMPYPDVRYIGNYFGAGTFIGEDGKTVVVPKQWIDGWKWYYNGIWVDHFIPSGPVRESSDFGASAPFNVGRAATTLSHLWNLSSITDLKNWDVAPVPSHNGVTTSNIHADTFRILEGSASPEAAFKALTYLVGDASVELVPAYGGMPARLADQGGYFKKLEEQYPWNVNWQVVSDSVAFADSPNNESWLPNTQESLDYLFTVISKWQTTPGLDMDAEVSTLVSELQAIWDKAAP